MSEHRAQTNWRRSTADFAYESYNRGYELGFDGGPAVAASAAPEFRGQAGQPNPESTLVAALSACHMLTFLAIAARKRLTLDSYSDDAVGHLEKNAVGKLAMTRAILRPHVVWAPGVTVSKDELDKLHRLAHAECFIANSVKTEVSVEPQA